MSHKPQVKELELELRVLVFKRGASKRKLTIPVAITFVETLNTTQCTCLNTCMPSSKSDSWPGLVPKGQVKFLGEIKNFRRTVINPTLQYFLWAGAG